MTNEQAKRELTPREQELYNDLIDMFNKQMGGKPLTPDLNAYAVRESIRRAASEDMINNFPAFAQGDMMTKQALIMTMIDIVGNSLRTKQEPFTEEVRRFYYAIGKASLTVMAHKSPEDFITLLTEMAMAQ